MEEHYNQVTQIKSFLVPNANVFGSTQILDDVSDAHVIQINPTLHAIWAALTDMCQGFTIFLCCGSLSLEIALLRRAFYCSVRKRGHRMGTNVGILDAFVAWVNHQNVWSFYSKEVY